MRNCQWAAKVKPLKYEDMLDVQQHIVDHGYNLSYPDEVYKYTNGFIYWFNVANTGLVFIYLRDYNGTIVGDDLVGALTK